MKERKISEIINKKLKICISILMVSVIIALGIYWFPRKKQEEDKKVDFSGVTRICELSTLKCYYHNVAKMEDFPKGVFKYGWGKYGLKKLWMEYDAYVEFGIDANEVEVYEPDEEGIVKIYIPKATIFNVYGNEGSMEKPICEEGVLTNITTEDQLKAYKNAQEDLRNEADIDKDIKEQAYNNAKKIMEQYIMTVGKQLGEQYTVEWLEKPNKKQ